MNRAAAAAIWALTLTAPAVRAGVDPALLALAPPDSKLLVGVQVEQVKSAPFGQYLVAQLKLDPSSDKSLIAAGFDPRRDLTELLVASNGANGAILLGRGSFESGKVGAAAMAAGMAASTYHDAQLLEYKSAKSPMGALAFLNRSIVIAGDSAAVRAAIDRHAAGESFSGVLAARARQISSANHVWVASLQPPAEALSGLIQNDQLKPLANVIKAAVQLSGGLKFTADDVTLSAEILTRSAAEAQQMAAMLKLAAAFLQSNSPQNANPAGSTPTPQITTSGPVAILAVSVPEKQLEQFFASGGPQRHSSSGPK